MRAAFLIVAFAATAIALTTARPPQTPGPYLRDFEAYYAGGSVWAEGGNPYGPTVWRVERTIPGVRAQANEVLPYVSPPAALPLFALFSRLPYSAAATLWTVVLASSLVALVVTSWTMSGGSIAPRALAALGLLTVGFGPITAALALGQLALLAAACTALCGASMLRGRSWAGAAWALPAALQPNLLPPLAMLLRSWRATHALLAAAVAVVLANALMALHGGTPTFAEYLALTARHAAAERFDLIQLTPAAIARGFGVSASFARLCGGLCIVLTIIASIVAFRRARTPLLAFAAGCALTPLIVPFVHEQDLCIVFPAAVAGIAHARSRGAQLLALAGTMLVAIDWLGLAQRPQGTLQSALLAVAAFIAAVTLLRRPGALPIALAAVGSSALFAAAARVARAHPAPIWPDAMHRFSMRSHDVAAIWHAEQAAAGMFAHEPTWAALRTLSLVGCALVAASCVLASDVDVQHAVER